MNGNTLPDDLDAADGCDALWHNARLATLNPRLPSTGQVLRGAIAVKDGRFVYVGGKSEMPASFANAVEVYDCGGRWITPGLIDCHTHLVHAGDRSREFELRLGGATYEQIAREGGGIISSVQALRLASEDDLVRESLPRLDALIREGVTTIEIKSGYGLDLPNELKSLRAARRLGVERDVKVVTTFLGAHALPPEFRANRNGYVDCIINEMLPAIAAEGLADAVDGFCESIAFTPEEIRRIFPAAARLGLRLKLHADQLSDSHGAELAARFGAISADHLEYTNEAGVMAMARAGTTAVLLPGAYYFLRETKKLPVELFRRHGVPMAVGTDCNPGTSPLTSLLLAMNMAATLFGLTVDECIAGVTRQAARALGRLGEIGTLEAGKQADFCLWNVDRPAELVYRMGFNPLHERIFNGKVAAHPRPATT